MPFAIHIDVRHGLAASRVLRPLTPAEIVAHPADFQSHPDFSPEMMQLMDCRDVMVDIDVDMTRQLGKEIVAFSPKSKRALVVGDELSFGLARMVNTNAGDRDIGQLRIFRDLENACEWLGISVELAGSLWA